MEFEEYHLSDICKYRKEKICTQKLKRENYISTDNMLPEKQGIGGLSDIPKIRNVDKFEIGDVLISNIRPYFKKIWFSDTNGGSSPDVLIFQPDEEKVIPEYLYYILSQDAFFNYMVQTSKGTKMPRGDKKFIMQYKVPLCNKEYQRKIVNLLSDLDKKIQTNKTIISNFEQLSRTLFKQWFIDFEFPNEDGKPYKSSGGEMLESKLGEIPVCFAVKKFEEIYLNLDKFRKPLSKKQRSERKGVYPYYGAVSVVDYIDDYLIDGIYILLSEDGANVVGPDGTPTLQYIWGKSWVNNHAHIISEKGPYSIEFLYYLLKTTYMKHLVTGAAQPKISQSNLNSLHVIVPNELAIKKFTELISPLFESIRVLSEESKKIQQLRETLLPKLLSGELEIPEKLEV